jgi:hypothetical protein
MENICLIVRCEHTSQASHCERGCAPRQYPVFLLQIGKVRQHQRGTLQATVPRFSTRALYRALRGRSDAAPFTY